MSKAFILLFVSFFIPSAHAHNRGNAVTGDLSLQVQCSNPANLQSVNPPYKETVGEALLRAGASNVKCTSCYRSPDEQRNACQRICGADSCPGLCARPGGSQHQKQHIAVCDLSGIPAGRQGCEILKRLCQEKYAGKCGIGGYPGGGFHFGVGDDHFSAWNQCGYLSGSMQEAQSQNALFQQLRQSILGR